MDTKLTPLHEFEGQTVIVTGAAGDFGRVLCDQFEAAGAEVIATDLVAAPGRACILGDITQPDFPHALVERAMARSGRIDVLINNAGLCPRVALQDITLAEWNRVLAVNLTGAFMLAQACLPVMQRRGTGAIVNLASLAAKVGGLTVGAHYTASKGAIIALTKTLARHAGPSGIRCNAVAPGFIAGHLTNEIAPEKLGEITDTIPLRRQGTPEEVASAILFLASPRASYITGVTLDVNGGILMD